MGAYNDTQHLYQVLEPFFNRLKDDPEIGPKVLASGLVIQFRYTEPDAVITIDCPGNAIVLGETETKPDVEMGMKADIAHRFWLGKVNLMIALTKREMTARGPVAKIMKLLPIIKGSYAMYADHLRNIGMGDKIEV